TGGLALLLAALSPYVMLAMHWNKSEDDKLRKPTIPYPFLLAVILGLQSSILMSSAADEWAHRLLISSEPPTSFAPLWTPPGGPESLHWPTHIQTMSIVLVGRNEHKYLYRTVDSIIKNTPSRRLKEIILVDDGSIPPMEPLLAEYRDKVRLIRHEKSQGLIRARMAGANAAVGDMVMFLDCHVKPAPGWERPMFKNTNENYKRLVVPLIPRLDGETWEVLGDEPGAKMMFDWGLQFDWFEDGNDEVPVMSGGLYAITKRWWHESGEYDYDMLLYGAEN
ncbi:hypothetical protein FOZ62_004274, partial [Perkinsus olseni]